VPKVGKPIKRATEDWRKNTAEEKQRNKESTDSIFGLNHYSSTPILRYSKLLRSTDHGPLTTDHGLLATDIPLMRYERSIVLAGLHELLVSA